MGQEDINDTDTSKKHIKKDLKLAHIFGRWKRETFLLFSQSMRGIQGHCGAHAFLIYTHYPLPYYIHLLQPLFHPQSLQYILQGKPWPKG